MKNGTSRFEFYLQKTGLLMQQAAKEPNPALWLYTNNARTPFFMLEALSRLYLSLHNKKKFTALKEHFKIMEDGFGSIDYYYNYSNLFLANSNVPVHIREYMQAQASEKMQYVNDLLVSNEWISENNGRIKKIRKKLNEADWLQPKEEAKAIMRFYEDEIEEIKKFVKAAKGLFTEMESQVHEFRRNVRWLSIYPQALQGMIQLTESGPPAKEVQKYLLPEIVDSKYNKMPDAGINTWFLMLEKNYFLSLSWLISETGKLKDEGLQLFAVSEALQQTEGLNQKDAWIKSFEVLGVETNTMEKLLARSSEIISIFIKEQNLDRLVYGLAHTQKAKSE